MRHLFVLSLLLPLVIADRTDPRLKNVRLPVDRSKGFFRKARVVIRNNLPNGLDLTVHCKSGDDDLGFHLLHPQQSFDFSFVPSIWENTLFFCSFQWTGAFHYYDVYVQKRDLKRCNECMWNVGPDGPCLRNERNGKFDYCDKWNPPSLA